MDNKLLEQILERLVEFNASLAEHNAYLNDLLKFFNQELVKEQELNLPSKKPDLTPILGKVREKEAFKDEKEKDEELNRYAKETYGIDLEDKPKENKKEVKKNPLQELREKRNQIRKDDKFDYNLLNETFLNEMDREMTKDEAKEFEELINNNQIDNIHDYIKLLKDEE